MMNNDYDDDHNNDKTWKTIQYVHISYGNILQYSQLQISSHPH